MFFVVIILLFFMKLNHSQIIIILDQNFCETILVIIFCLANLTNYLQVDQLAPYCSFIWCN